MRPIQPQPMIDPLGAFMAHWLERHDVHPVPLASTGIDVNISSGLAVVETRRLFRNDEKTPIEAVMTFPVPVHAVLFALEARIDGRLVKGCARQRQQAREVYEAAVEAGKAAVLHEEVLRGIHTLSAANIRPGGEIEVTLRWAAALSHVAGQGLLRIPLTVGDVYGCSGLPDADKLTHSAREPQCARLQITCPDGNVVIAGLTPTKVSQDGAYSVPLNRPIDLIAPVPADKELCGIAADHRRVTLTISPALIGEHACRLAVLADHSGSMAGAFGADAAGAQLSKHEATLKLVKSITASLRAGDELDLWQFDNAAERVGLLESFDLASLGLLLTEMSPPRGGTEIGRSIARVARESAATDILLVTDGKSHALDVQTIAGLGRRISVLLIGEDSLDANVGHLAALTGGELFIATPSNLETVADSLISAMRWPPISIATVRGPLEAAVTRRSGVDICAQWGEPAESAIAETPWTRAIGAFAASLAIPTLDEARAGALAETEGLVTHLTSVVLVDEAGEAVEGLPGMRKVPLETPASFSASYSRSIEPDLSHSLLRSARAVSRSESSLFERVASTRRPHRKTPDISGRRIARMLMELSAEIDWDSEPSRLLACDVDYLPSQLSGRLELLVEELRDSAELLKMAWLDLTIALLAHCASEHSRSAARIAHSLLGRCDLQALSTVLNDLGLPLYRR